MTSTSACLKKAHLGTMINTTKIGESFTENICHNYFFSISRRHVGRITNMSSDASNLVTVFDIHKIMFYSTDHTRREKTSSCLFSRAKFRLAIKLLDCALFYYSARKYKKRLPSLFHKAVLSRNATLLFTIQ